MFIQNKEMSKFSEEVILGKIVVRIGFRVLFLIVTIIGIEY